MGLLHALKKIGKVAAFAAPIIASPFTGGASLALLGAASGAGGALLNGGGLKSALIGGGLGAIPGLGKAGKLGALGKVVGGASGASAGGQPVGFGAKLGQLFGQQAGAGKLSNIISAGQKISDIAGLAGNVDTALHGGVDPVTRGRQAGANASALLNQRYDAARLTPGAVGADRQAFANMMRASNIARYQPNPVAQGLWAKYGQHALTPTPEAMQFAGQMRDQLNSRIANHQALTLNGPEAASPEELAAHNQALKLQNGPGGVVGALQTGASIAGMIPQIGSVFSQPKRTPPFVGPQLPDVNSEDNYNG